MLRIIKPSQSRAATMTRKCPRKASTTSSTKFFVPKLQRYRNLQDKDKQTVPVVQVVQWSHSRRQCRRWSCSLPCHGLGDVVLGYVQGVDHSPGQEDVKCPDQAAQAAQQQGGFQAPEGTTAKALPVPVAGHGCIDSRTGRYPSPLPELPKAKNTKATTGEVSLGESFEERTAKARASEIKARMEKEAADEKHREWGQQVYTLRRKCLEPYLNSADMAKGITQMTDQLSWAESHDLLQKGSTEQEGELNSVQTAVTSGIRSSGRFALALKAARDLTTTMASWRKLTGTEDPSRASDSDLAYEKACSAQFRNWVLGQWTAPKRALFIERAQHLPADLR